MELFICEKIENDPDNMEYAIKFNRTPKTVAHFDKFMELVGKIYDKKFDFDRRAWKMTSGDVDVLRAADERLFPPKKTMKQKMKTLIDVDKKIVTDYDDIGKDMKLQPYDYQKEITKFALDAKSALIVAPCGSGKTPIGIAIYLEAIKHGVIDGIGLIVVKASLKSQWASEVMKFSHLKPKIIQTMSDATNSISSKIKRREKKLSTVKTETQRRELETEIAKLKKEKMATFREQFKEAQLLILNYETLRDQTVRSELHRLKPQYIFADEVHYVKSESTDRSKALCEFSEAEIKVGATATPVQRDPRDLFGLFKFINPSLFPSSGNFGRLYVKWAGRGRAVGSKNEKLLNQKISPYMIIKTKEEVAKQLPKLVVMQRYCDLGPAQLEMTNRIKEELDELHEQEKRLQEKLSDHELKTDPQLKKIEAGILMRQTFAQEIADSEQLLLQSDSEAAKSYTTGEADNKIDMLMELLEEIIGSEEKVCIFSRFAKLQPILTDRIQKEAKKKSSILHGAKIAYVNGSISGERRFDEVYNKFRDTDEYKILLCSDAGAEGLNLSQCKYLIEMEPAESYAIQTQRHGRLERADSVHDTVFVYQLIANESYDEIGMKIVAKKERYDSQIIKGMEYEAE